MIKNLCKMLSLCQINDFVISESLREVFSDKELSGQCYYSEDPRSMMYIATGISAETNKMIAVICKGTNESRSAYSGLTEAYYRRLPVLFISIGGNLDYSKELKDCCIRNYKGTESVSLALADVKKYSLPVHLEISYDYEADKISLKENTVSAIKKVNHKDSYLFVSQSFCHDFDNTQGKVVSNKACTGVEGCLSNVLGASLGKIRKRYIGLVSETEFIHDINTLGNININDLIAYIVVCKESNSFIKDYSDSLGFVTREFSEESITYEKLLSLMTNEKKTVIIITQNQR